MEKEPDGTFVPREGPFRHGVASGDPLPNAVVLWTRISDAEGVVGVKWEIATDAAFTNVVGGATVTTSAERDFTVKVDADGLEPGTTYYYRFITSEEISPIGRTKTAPLDANRLRFAVVTCASLAHGYFWVYAAIAARADIDAVIHVGDYLYEYGDGQYGGKRPYFPTHELRALGDYRARYAQYRSDVDLAELHRQHPIIATWDDHEVCDNAFRDLCGEHSPEEGPYIDRKRAAYRAYMEWMPIRELGEFKLWRRLRYGTLADLIVLDARHWGKDQQAADPDFAAQAAPERQLLGADQEAWAIEQLTGSTATWKVVCQQVMMSPLPQYTNTDQWDGYKASRERIYAAIETGGVKDVVVLTGDIHASFANDLARQPLEPAAYDGATGRGSIAVELVTPAVTSETAGAINPKELVEENPWMKFVNNDRHGYVLLDLDETRAQGAFYYVQDVGSRNFQTASFERAFATYVGENHLREDPGAPVPEDVQPLAPGPVSTSAAQMARPLRTFLPRTGDVTRQKFGDRVAQAARRTSTG